MFVLRQRAIACLLVAVACATGSSAAAKDEIARVVWRASWIDVAGAEPSDYGVYHFRRTFDLADRPSQFVVHVSADNRYELFVNGERVAVGPARGDPMHWRYDTVDIAPALRAGRNTLAAVVWNYGTLAPTAQWTVRTGFLLQAEKAADAVVDTNEKWRAVRDEAYAPLPVAPATILYQYYVAGPGESVDGARYPWGWERSDYDDARWPAARVIARAGNRGDSDALSPWMLVARTIPMMEEREERFARVRRASGVAIPPSLPASRASFEIPPNTTARILLDNDRLTTAYPEITVSGGQGATIEVTYAETLFVPGTMEKGDRDVVEGKEIRGNRDRFVADGGARRRFRPLWWRTYRYVALEIVTKEASITVDDLSARFSGYPFERRAAFASDAPELERILDVGWRTARLCAHETFMDCPYYEQLQYVGDTRIQALVALYMTGDDRLVRNAIATIDESRTAEGLTLSRAPSRDPQYIPPFSLWWIGMVHDYWWYRDDPEFVRAMLPGVRAVLTYFRARQRESGSLGKIDWWNFVDWTAPWPGGVPPGPNEPPSWARDRAGDRKAVSRSSALLDLQLLLALEYASDLERSVGSASRAAEFRDDATRLRAEIRRLYWDAERRLFADTPERTSNSQHANILAILGQVVVDGEASELVARILDDLTLAPASIYFRYYLHEALRRAGEGDRFLDLLGPWREMLAKNLTTWSETLDPSRSECHAWGSSPNVELFRTVLGVDAAAPGFSRVAIRPHLGTLRSASGIVPHPRGEIRVALTRDGDALRADVDLPPGVPGVLGWRGETRDLPPGHSSVTLGGR